VPLKTLVQQITLQKPYLLLGERHGVVAHPQAAACLFSHFNALSKTLVMEHFTQDQQGVIDETRQKTPESVAPLGAALHWHQSGWPRFSVYLPLLNAAWISRTPLKAGDVAKGKEAELAPLPLTMQNQQRAKGWQEALNLSTCGLKTVDELGHLAQVQMARDAQMLSSLTALENNADMTFLYAGRSHVRRDRAVPLLYQAQATPQGQNKRPLISLAFYETASEGQTTDKAAVLKANKGVYDYLWFVGENRQEDPCKKLDALGLIPKKKQ
jgi:uncharacterized iron-regulated protein